MSDIIIANARELPPPAEWPPYVVYVGRANNRRGLAGSPLANPYAIGDRVPRVVLGKARKDGTRPRRMKYSALSRGAAVALYRSWLQSAAAIDYQSRGPGVRPARAELDRLRALLAEHGRLTLVCYCVPLPCHAEVIRDHLLGGLT